MADLNLRNVHPGLIAKLKADAALAGATLREHCVALLTSQGHAETLTKAVPTIMTAKPPQNLQPLAQAVTASSDEWARFEQIKKEEDIR